MITPQETFQHARDRCILEMKKFFDVGGRRPKKFISDKELFFQSLRLRYSISVIEEAHNYMIKSFGKRLY